MRGLKNITHFRYKASLQSRQQVFFVLSPISFNCKEGHVYLEMFLSLSGCLLRIFHFNRFLHKL